MKLTQAQQDVLDELGKPGVVAHYMPYLGRFIPEPYWFLSSTHKKCTKQMEKLIKLGLAKIIQSDFAGATAVASITGKDAKK
jgi:hypothetical protein